MNPAEHDNCLSVSRIELECAHGDRLSVEVATRAADPDGRRARFLAVSAAYLLGARRGAQGERSDDATEFALSYRRLIGDEVAWLVVTRLRDQLAQLRASLPE
jgi:hypothetical protein